MTSEIPDWLILQSHIIKRLHEILPKEQRTTVVHIGNPWLFYKVDLGDRQLKTIEVDGLKFLAWLGSEEATYDNLVRIFQKKVDKARKKR